MSHPHPDRLAVCSWSLQPASPDELIDRLKETGLSRTQLYLGAIAKEDPAWVDAPQKLQAAGIEIVSGMMGAKGEDYSTLETIRRTGGIVPDEHWPANREHAGRIAPLAQSLGLKRVSFHAGFIPHEPGSGDFDKLKGRVVELVELFAAHRVSLLLETGQETADALVAFLDAVGRPTVGVNFDPANMLLYGMGDPIAALRTLMPRVGQVHLKDAVPSDTPGQWGTEVAVGEGAVDWPTFVSVLKEAGYAGDLVIEREAGAARAGDVRKAVEQMEALL